MTEFKVGDKVRATTNNYGMTTKKNGWEGVVKKVGSCEFSAKTTAGRSDDIGYVFDGLNVEDFELIDAKPTKGKSNTKARISELERKVAELTAKVEALESAKKPTEKFAKIRADFTPNEERKAIIAEAKAFVEKYSGIVYEESTPYTTEAGDTIVKLFVNKEKRIVTAIPHLVHVDYDAMDDKKFAKCAPDDVFNVDIGKAIALGRALGLDVERFEQAVQPTEVVAGMRVEFRGTTVKIYAVRPKQRTYGVGKGGGFFNASNGFTYIDEDDYEYWAHINHLDDILDDTEAQY